MSGERSQETLHCSFRRPRRHISSCFSILDSFRGKEVKWVCMRCRATHLMTAEQVAWEDLSSERGRREAI